MNDQSSLRDQIAEALIARIKLATVKPDPPHYYGGSIGHFLAATEYDLADVALSVLQPVLDERDAEIKRLDKLWREECEHSAYLNEELIPAERKLHEETIARAEKAEAEGKQLRDQQAGLIGQIGRSELAAALSRGTVERIRALATGWSQIPPEALYGDQERAAVLRSVGKTILAELDQPTHRCPRCGEQTPGQPLDLCPPCELGLANDCLKEERERRESAEAERDDYTARLKATDRSWAEVAAERDQFRDILRDAVTALDDLGACENPSCDKPKCLRILPRLRAALDQPTATRTEDA